MMLLLEMDAKGTYPVLFWMTKRLLSSWCSSFPSGVDHTVLTQVGEHFLNIRSGTGTTGAAAQYRGGELNHHLEFYYSFHTSNPNVIPCISPCPVSRWAPSAKHQQYCPLGGGEPVSGSRQRRGSGLQCAAAFTGSWSAYQEGLQLLQQTGPGCCQGNCWPLWCEWLSVCNLKFAMTSSTWDYVSVLCIFTMKTLYRCVKSYFQQCL